MTRTIPANPTVSHASHVLTRIFNQFLERLTPEMQKLADQLEKLGAVLREASKEVANNTTTSVNRDRLLPPRIHRGTVLATATSRPPALSRLYRRRTP